MVKERFILDMWERIVRHLGKSRVGMTRLTWVM